MSKCFDSPGAWFGGMGDLNEVHDGDDYEDEPAGHDEECECDECLEKWERENLEHDNG